MDSLKRKDAIMEGDIEEVIQRMGSENMEEIVEELVDSYQGTSQICNIMCGMLDKLGDPSPSKRNSTDSTQPESSNFSGRKESMQVVEEAYNQLIFKKFQPELADHLLNNGKEDLEWLSKMILNKKWRLTLYKLMENHEQCEFLKHVVKLISDAGYRNEMSNVNCAAQQLNMFSKVFVSALDDVLTNYKKAGYTEAIEKLRRIALQGMHTYLYSITLLRSTANAKGGWIRAACEFIQDELKSAAIIPRDSANVLQLRMSSKPFSNKYSRSILSLANTNTNQISTTISLIHEQFMASPPPPINVLRDPVILNYLVDILFDAKGVKLQTESDELRIKCVYLLAYAAATIVDENTNVHDTSSLENCQAEIENVLGYLDCEDCLIVLFQHFLESCETAVIACGMLHYCKTLLTSDTLCSTETINSAYVILDNIATHHQHLRADVFDAFCEIFEKIGNENMKTAAELIIERQRLVVDRFVHLLSVGEVIPILDWMKWMVSEDSIDVSLVRYFLLEVLDLIGPPYTAEFANSFLCLLQNQDIFDHEQLAKHSIASEFIKHCANM
ncbi:unnamed protein product [Caenorhabditis angaria]|uniref:Uncharacterized protein n=1 Tax=Caenorhabditis angaria TaxID=860376 RepID=A0A9P1I676_9PELO|nr:unnamed protein product [Caenorhabditis angaria]